MNGYSSLSPQVIAPGRAVDRGGVEDIRPFQVGCPTYKRFVNLCGIFDIANEF